jgi:hypothetical protein
VFLGLVGGLCVYELVTLANNREGDTISEIMWATTTRRPILPFAFGVLMGHFFWQRVESDPPAPSPGRL